jgi:hypothetical protein
MNIYVLDLNPRLAAQYHNDRHVDRQIYVTAQLLCTAHYRIDGARKAGQRVPAICAVRYASDSAEPWITALPQDVKHPCLTWACTTSGAYEWLHKLLMGLLEERQLRRRSAHVYANNANGPGLAAQLARTPMHAKPGPYPSFVQAMPTQYMRADPVRAYRLYYFYEKAHIAQWTGPMGTPLWWDKLGVSEIRWLMRKQLMHKQEEIARAEAEKCEEQEDLLREAS